MREFALVPGLTKIMNRDDWVKVFQAYAQMPDYRETKYASYFLTQDARIRAEKLYYVENALKEGGREYKVISHRVIPISQTNTDGNYDIVGYDFVASANYSNNTVTVTDQIYSMFEEGCQYYIMGSYAVDKSFTMTPLSSSDGVATGITINSFITHPTTEFKKKLKSGLNRIYKRTITNVATNATTGPAYYQIDYARGTLTTLIEMSDGAHINEYIYSPTPDRVYIKGHVYYRRGGNGNNVYTLMTGWKAGDIISDVSTVYNRGDDIWLVNSSIIGELTHGKRYFERTGRRFPYEGFVAVATEAASGYSKGTLYRCVRDRYNLTEDTIRNWDKSYFEYHEDTARYVERDAGSDMMYRAVDGNTFIQAADTDVFVNGVVYYWDLSLDYGVMTFETPISVIANEKYTSGNTYFRKDENGYYKKLYEGDDYKNGDTTNSNDVYTTNDGYIIGEYISDYVDENDEYPGIRNRKLFWRNGWNFNHITNLYGITTDTKFDFSKRKYYVYRGTGYEFEEITANNVYTITPDEVFGYRKYTAENYGFVGYRRLRVDVDYAVGDTIVGAAFKVNADGSAINTSSPITGQYEANIDYWVRDEDIFSYKTVTDATTGNTTYVYTSKYCKFDTSINKIADRPITEGADGSSLITVDNVGLPFPDNLDLTDCYIPYEVSGFNKYTAADYGYVGYRRLKAGKDYDIGTAISGDVFYATSDKLAIDADPEHAAQGTYQEGVDYWVRDTYILDVKDKVVTSRYFPVDQNTGKPSTTPLIAAWDSIPLSSKIGSAFSTITKITGKDNNDKDIVEVFDMTNYVVQYKDVPSYYTMANKDSRTWTARFELFPVSNKSNKPGYDYYGTKVSGQAETIYTRSNEGTIPTTVDVCVKFDPNITSGDALISEDGLYMPSAPALYTTARAGEDILKDEYYEESTGVYIWKPFFIDKGVSSSTVYDVKAYFDNDKIYLSWTDPELMIDADDVTAGVDSWYKTTIDFIDDSGNAHQMLVETYKNEYSKSFFVWDCNKDLAEGSYKININDMGTGSLRITAISRSGRLAPTKIAKIYAIVSKHNNDKEFVATTSTTALPGLVYYNSITDAEIFNVEPYVTTLPNFYIKYQDDVDLYDSAVVNSSVVYKPITDAVIGERVVTTPAKYIRIYTNPEVTFTELARSGELQQIYQVGDEVSLPRDVVTGTAGEDLKCVIAGYNIEPMPRTYEVGYEPIDHNATFEAGVEYFLRTKTTSIECTTTQSTSNNYQFAKIYGLPAGVAVSTLFNAQTTVYKHRTDGQPHYQFYTRTVDPSTGLFTYTKLVYDAAGAWKTIVTDSSKQIFYRDNAYKSNSSSDTNVAYGEYKATGQSVTLTYTIDNKRAQSTIG